MIRLSRHRGAGLLGALLLGQLLLLGFQLRAPGQSRLDQRWSLELLLPLENTIHAGVGWATGGARHYLMLVRVRRQNAELRRELAQLRLENAQLAVAGEENVRLRRLLGLHPKYVAGTLTATVIGRGPAPQSQILYLDRGARQGVRAGMPVITPQGVVGKIERVLANESQAMVLTDPSLGAGAASGDGAVSGVLRGAGAQGCRLQWIRVGEPVKPGELLLTSGQDRIFPPGLPLGRVESVRAGNLFQHIRVKPLARLNSLREVLIVTRLGALPAGQSGAATGTTQPGLSQLPALPAQPLGPQKGPPLPMWEWNSLRQQNGTAMPAKRSAAANAAQAPTSGRAPAPNARSRAAAKAGMAAKPAVGMTRPINTEPIITKPGERRKKAHTGSAKTSATKPENGTPASPRITRPPRQEKQPAPATRNPTTVNPPSTIPTATNPTAGNSSTGNTSKANAPTGNAPAQRARAAGRRVQATGLSGGTGAAQVQPVAPASNGAAPAANKAAAKAAKKPHRHAGKLI